jgi:antitoxin YobK
MTDIEKALALLRDHPDADFVGPRSEALVAAAEATLDLTFPPSYRRFLRELGCGNIAGLEIYGLINANFETASIPDGVWLTLADRQHLGLPENLFLFAETGDGGYYAMNCEDLHGGEAVVVAWRDGLEDLPVVAGSFGEFLLRALQQRLGKPRE